MNNVIGTTTSGVKNHRNKYNDKFKPERVPSKKPEIDSGTRHCNNKIKKSLESQQTCGRRMRHSRDYAISFGSSKQRCVVGARLVSEMVSEYTGDGEPGDDPDEYTCPIGLELMSDPVITPMGITYDRKFIVDWIEKEGTDPFTKKALRVDDLTPNIGLKNAINRYLQQPKIWEIIEELEAAKRKVARQEAKIEELGRLYEDQRKETAALISLYENKITGLSAGQEQIAASEAAAESKADVCGEIDYVNQARILLGQKFIGREELERWGISIKGEVPELPEGLVNSLEEVCPITKEGQVKDTHILVLNPGLSIQDWHQIIDNKQHRSEHNGVTFYFEKSKAWYANKNESFYKEKGEVGWCLILAKPQPGSNHKTYSEMDAMELAEGYTGGGINDLVVGVCSYYLNSGKNLFPFKNNQAVLSMSSTDARSCRVYINFDDARLNFGEWRDVRHKNYLIGRGVLRK